MLYYAIRVYTPFVGEEADVYICAENHDEYISKANEAAGENGMEWFDEEEWLERWGFDKDEDDAEAVIEEYYAQCGWRFISEITKEEYEQKNKDGEWCV